MRKVEEVVRAGEASARCSLLSGCEVLADGAVSGTRKEELCGEIREGSPRGEE